MNKRQPRTATEVLELLGQDEGFIARAESAALMHQCAVDNGLQARDIVNSELRSLGIIEDYATFPNKSTPVEAFPVLLKHLKLGALPRIELGVLARCFGFPSAADYWDEIVYEFRLRMSEPDSDPVKQGLAIAIGRMCVTRDQLAELYELIEDRRFGAVRVALMDKVRRADILLFQELFERLVERDEDVREEIASWTNYWKKKNPSIIEKWGGKSKKKTQKS